MLTDWAAEACGKLAIKRHDFRFGRRQVRAVTGFGDAN